jgi:hypothetical protein
LRQYLFDRTTWRKLNHNEIQYHDPQQRWDHEKQAPDDVCEHCELERHLGKLTRVGLVRA